MCLSLDRLSMWRYVAPRVSRLASTNTGWGGTVSVCGEGIGDPTLDFHEREALASVVCCVAGDGSCDDRGWFMVVRRAGLVHATCIGEVDDATLDAQLVGKGMQQRVNAAIQNCTATVAATTDCILTVRTEVLQILCVGATAPPSHVHTESRCHRSASDTTSDGKAEGGMRAAESAPSRDSEGDDGQTRALPGDSAGTVGVPAPGAPSPIVLRQINRGHVKSCAAGTAGITSAFALCVRSQEIETFSYIVFECESTEDTTATVEALARAFGANSDRKRLSGLISPAASRKFLFSSLGQVVHVVQYMGMMEVRSAGSRNRGRYTERLRD